MTEPIDPEVQRSNRRVGRGCLLLLLLPILFVGGCTAIVVMNQKPYDPNNSVEAISQCETRVEEQLKAPATAEFDSEAKGGGPWQVTGTVDSENGFGAMIRSTYQCTVTINGDRATTTIDLLE